MIGRLENQYAADSQATVKDGVSTRMRHLRLVLVDLDHTIVDHASTLTRLSDRLSAMLPQSGRGPSPGEAYLLIHEKHDVLWNLGLIDIRRHWLSFQAFLLTMCLCNREMGPDIFPLLRDLREGDDDSAVSLAHLTLQKAQALINVPETREHLSQLLTQAYEDQSLIGAYGDHDDLFSSLGDLLDTTYIYSEGYRKLQLLKFTRIGLDRWVPPSRLVTTDDLVPREMLQGLRIYEHTIRRYLGASHSEALLRSAPASSQRRMAMNLLASNQIKRALDAASIVGHARDLERLLQALLTLQSLLATTTQKSNQRFLRAFLNAVEADPSSPATVAQTFLDPPEACRFKIVLVGDRYDTDMYPILAMYGDDAVSIRVRRGKYSEQQPASELHAENLPPPTFEVPDLHGVRDLCVDSRTWDRIPWVAPPAWLPENQSAEREALEPLLSLPPTALPRVIVEAIFARS